MKTTLLISAAFLLSIATFAQTSVKNQETVNNATALKSKNAGSEVKSSGSTSASASIRSNKVTNAEQKSLSAAEKAKTEIATEKQEMITKAETKKQQAKKIVSQDATVSANAQSGTKIATGEKNNKVSENTYVNSGAGVSSSTGIKASSNQLKEEGKNSVGAGTSLAAKKSNMVKTEVNKTTINADHKIHTASETTLKAGSSAAHSIKPGSAHIKMKTQVKTGAGIRIK